MESLIIDRMKSKTDIDCLNSIEKTNLGAIIILERLVGKLEFFKSPTPKDEKESKRMDKSQTTLPDLSSESSDILNLAQQCEALFDMIVHGSGKDRQG